MGKRSGRIGGGARLRPLFGFGRFARVARFGRSSCTDEPILEVPATTTYEEVLTQIALAHATSERLAVAEARMPPTQEEVTRLAAMAAENDLDGALALVTSMVSQGVSLDSVLLLLLAPAARLLGDGWHAEDCPFTDVMAGLEILQEVAVTLTSSVSTSGPD